MTYLLSLLFSQVKPAYSQYAAKKNNTFLSNAVKYKGINEMCCRINREHCKVSVKSDT